MTISTSFISTAIPFVNAEPHRGFAYELVLADCFDLDREILHERAFAQVDAHARRRYRAFGGNVVDCDATFFCVVLARQAIERVGPLDERFFPGGYEDDDYCLRARQAGLSVHVDRGVFLPPSQFEATSVSLAHTDADVDDVIAAAKSSLA